MSEAFITLASNALNNAWTQNNMLNVDCAPLTDALTHLAMNVSTLTNELASVREQCDQLRSQQIQMGAEVSAQNTRVTSNEKNVSQLLDAAVGMVPRQEYQSEMSSVRHELDAKHKDLQDLLLARMQSVTRASDEDRERVTHISQAVDGVRTTQGEGFSNTRQALSQLENQMRGLNAERAQQHLQLVQKHEDLVEDVTNKFNATRTELLEKIDNAKNIAADSIAKNVDELLQHLDAQATRVDKLQRAVELRDSTIPNKSEVVKLVSAMSESKQQVEDCQTQLQETFAQCMTLLESSAAPIVRTSATSVTGGGGGGGGGGGASPSIGVTSASFSGGLDATAGGSRLRGTSVMSQSATTAAAAAVAAAAAASDTTAAPAPNNASFASSPSSSFLGATYGGSGGQNLPSGAAAAALSQAIANNNGNMFTAAFSIFENRLDHIQQQVERILHEELPWLASEAKAKHEDHLVLVQAQKRAETMLIAVCDVCGLGTAENFAAALRLPTVQKAQSIVSGALKRLLQPVMDELVTPQFLAKLLPNAKISNNVSGGGGGAKENFADDSAQNRTTQLLSAPTLTAANQRYEAAVRQRGGSVVNSPASASSQQQHSSGSSSSSTFFAHSRLRLGIDIGDVPSPRDKNVGAVGIMSVAAGSAAEKSGLLRGDALVNVEKTEVRSCEQFMGVIHQLDRKIKQECRARGETKLHGSAEVTVLRSGTVPNISSEVRVTLKLEWA